MIFPDYNKLVHDKKQSIIDYYVNEYGEEYRSMFNDRFDKINFCFLATPKNIEDYIEVKLLSEYKKEFMNFFREIGLDISTIKESEIFFTFRMHKDYQTAGAFFPYELSNLSLESLGNINGIWSFLDNDEVRESAKKEVELINSFIGEGEKLTVESYLNDCRVTLLERLKLKSSNIDNSEYVKTEEYKKYFDYFSKVATLALEHKKKADNKFIDLYHYGEALQKRMDALGYGMEKRLILDSYYEYLSEEDKKLIEENPDFKSTDLASRSLLFGEDILSAGSIEQDKSDSRRSEIADSRELSYANYNVALASMSIVNGKTFVGHDINKAECILNPGINFFISPYANKRADQTYIYISPLGEAVDIALRHEIRHALTNSLKVKNGVTERKGGNSISYFKGDNFLSKKHEVFNEALTQYEAINETMFSWSNGNYIISEPGEKLDSMCMYDKWIPRFKIIYDELPKEAKMSQAEETNDNLYKYLSEDDILMVERILELPSYRDEEARRKLEEMANKIKTLASEASVKM